MLYVTCCISSEDANVGGFFFCNVQIDVQVQRPSIPSTHCQFLIPFTILARKYKFTLCYRKSNLFQLVEYSRLYKHM